MEKRNICLTIAQIRSHVNFGKNLREAKTKDVRFYFVTLKWHRSTFYVNWAILIGVPVDVTTLLLCTGDLQLTSGSEGRHTYLVSSLQMTLRKACLDPEIFPRLPRDQTHDLWH